VLRLIFWFFLYLYFFSLFKGLTAYTFIQLFVRCWLLKNIFVWSTFLTRIVNNLTLTLLFLLLWCGSNIFLFFISFVIFGRLFFWDFATLRFMILNIVFNFMKNRWVSFDAIIIVIDKIFLRFTLPWTPTYHIEISLVWFFKLLISFEAMFLKSVSSPWENIKHTRVFSSIFSGLAKCSIWEVYSTTFFPDIFSGGIFHISIKYIYF